MSTQAPVDVAAGSSVPAEVFTRRLRAGPAGSTVTYTFDRYAYTFAIAGGDPTLQPVAMCTPTGGQPVAIATTQIIARGRG